ncbi:MAG: hypothetical protein J5592_07195 [Clostridia bacterium]|nr:hypothetical protein [Clostridia bacterium]
MKRIISSVLAVLMLLGSNFIPFSAGADNTLDYPELVITEIGVDQYGDAANAKNTNTKYSGPNASRDPYEFIEICNNSDKKVNIYDYMLAYQGTGSDDADFFESSVQEYTPFHPGKDWADAPYGAIAKYWTGSVPMPENPAYEAGEIAPGEVFVVWMFNEVSNSLNCTFEQFRNFWSIDQSVKVFILDADGADAEMNFSLKNSKTGTYAVMVQSERFPKRRSSDKAYYPESDNKHHNYFKKTYEELPEIVNWAVVDYKTEPLKSFSESNGGEMSQTNFTVSYLPETANSKEGNGYRTTSFASGKRSHLSKISLYAEATVGKLDAEQTAAFAKTVTGTVHGVKSHEIYTDPENNDTKPDLLITRISPDQYASASGNKNPEYTGSRSGNDPFEFIEVYNNSGKEINIYDYMVGYQGANAAAVSTYFERLVQEYTAIFPGDDWIDAPWGQYDSYWTDRTMPVNPGYEEGVLKAGEICLLWFYNFDSHANHARIDEFRSFWKVPENAKVFLVDADSNLDKNFNIKNSATGTYVIMKPSSRYPQRRSNDETLDTENAKRFWSLDLTYADMPEVVSWAVVDFGCYEPLYSFSGNNSNSSFSTNYTLLYAPGDPAKPEFVNGFKTTSFVSPKRCHFSSVTKTYADSSVGVLNEAQKAAIGIK